METLKWENNWVRYRFCINGPKICFKKSLKEKTIKKLYNNAL